MKHIYQWTAFAVCISLYVVGASPAHAVDLEVVCDNQSVASGDCVMTPAAMPLFEESNFLPGDTAVQTLTVVNRDARNVCNLSVHVQNIRDTDLLATQLFTAIVHNGDALYGQFDLGKATSQQTLANLLAAPSVSLGTIQPRQVVEYSWATTFNPLADNQYQLTQTVFDLVLQFSCQEAPVPTPPPDDQDPPLPTLPPVPTVRPHPSTVPTTPAATDSARRQRRPRVTRERNLPPRTVSSQPSVLGAGDELLTLQCSRWYRGLLPVSVQVFLWAWC